MELVFSDQIQSFIGDSRVYETWTCGYWLLYYPIAGWQPVNTMGIQMICMAQLPAPIQ